MAWVLLDENKVVIQKQPNEQEGFIEVDEKVSCGMEKQGDKFVNPQKDKISLDNEQIKEQLYILDLKSIRALREGDSNFLSSIEEEAKELRKSLKTNPENKSLDGK